MITKWFYKAQEEASNELYKQFENVVSHFQVISKDRIIEGYECSTKGDNKRKLIQVLINKQGSGASVLIYELAYIQGWKAN